MENYEKGFHNVTLDFGPISPVMREEKERGKKTKMLKLNESIFPKFANRGQEKVSKTVIFEVLSTLNPFHILTVQQFHQLCNSAKH